MEKLEIEKYSPERNGVGSCLGYAQGKHFVEVEVFWSEDRNLGVLWDDDRYSEGDMKEILEQRRDAWMDGEDDDCCEEYMTAFLREQVIPYILVYIGGMEEET